MSPPARPPVAVDLGAYASRLDARLDALAARALHGGGEEAAMTVTVAPPFSSAKEAAEAFARGGAPLAERAADDRPPPAIYGRWSTPSTRSLELRLAAVEGCEDVAVAASGMAAISGALFALVKAGDHVVAPRSLYAETARLLREHLPRFGVRTTFIDGVTPADYEGAIEPSTKVLYLETPSNPVLRVTDVAAVVAVAARHGLKTIADGTFGTPFAQSLSSEGVDVVVHSLTKGLGGHGDAIGGACFGARATILPIRDLLVKGLGGALAPETASRLLRGVRTFPLRQHRANLTAAKVAAHLEARGDVTVLHPSLASHPDHELATRTLHAYGAVIAFKLPPSGDTIARGRRFFDALRVFTRAVSLGDVQSLAIHPASTTHASMPEADRRQAGIDDGLVRLSIGLEGAAELCADLDRALAASE